MYWGIAVGMSIGIVQSVLFRLRCRTGWNAMGERNTTRNLEAIRPRMLPNQPPLPLNLWLLPLTTPILLITPRLSRLVAQKKFIAWFCSSLFVVGGLCFVVAGAPLRFIALYALITWYIVSMVGGILVMFTSGAHVRQE